jgi:hypothetical protein
MSQPKRFLETARQLECDEDKERFEEKLGRTAAANPKMKAGSPSRSRTGGQGTLWAGPRQ